MHLHDTHWEPIGSLSHLRQQERPVILSPAAHRTYDTSKPPESVDKMGMKSVILTMYRYIQREIRGRTVAALGFRHQ